MTGHAAAGRRRSLAPCAAPGGTLCIYMGLGRLPRLVEELAAGGWSRRTPVAVVESATLPAQRTVTGTLGSIAGRVTRAGVASPALVIVGRVVARRHRTAARVPRAAETRLQQPAGEVAAGRGAR